MDELILKYEDYSLWKVSQENLYVMVEFVVKTNYIKHQNDIFPVDVDNEINDIYKSEIEYSSNSLFYALKDNENKVIGAIRVMKWDGNSILPIQKDFGVDIEKIGIMGRDIWHVGRFAVHSDIKSFKILVMFKTLLYYAISPICESRNNIMLAECDRKLLLTLRRLHIDIEEIGQSMIYLGSETCPILSDTKGLTPFLDENPEYSEKCKKCA